mmetsp:Transcript_131646/g.294586  ORF Transcript_131646/g.294586 Transcript_131646/m.294586 type:complete len:250 (-) Transcript_131646:104-853(-)
MYAVFICVIAFMVTLVMISILTSSLTQQYIIGGTGARQLATLKQYLNQNSVSKNLTKRICRNAKEAFSGDLSQDRVELLKVISEPLKLEMSFDIYSRILDWHPFFRGCLNEDVQVMKRVCDSAMSMLLSSQGDVIFGEGEEPEEPKMYFVVKGSLSYNLSDAIPNPIQVGAKTWVSEAALWTEWRHQGTLTASSDVKLAVLDSEAFQDIFKTQMRKKNCGFNPKPYARGFVDDLNKASRLSDLPEKLNW